jgi:outer membrane immunogenic protein
LIPLRQLRAAKGGILKVQGWAWRPTQFNAEGIRVVFGDVVMARIPALLTAFAALTALAQPAVAQNYDGQGRLRFGVFMQGYSLPAKETTPVVGTTDIGGFGIGASFGYDWSLGNGWIIGAEADATATDASAARVNGQEYNVGYLATGRARLGHQIHQNWLLYGTGGLALTGIRYKGPTPGFSTTGDNNLRVAATLTGWTAGGGIEYRFYDTVLFGEYLYSNYENFSFTGGGNINRELELDSHAVRFGVKWIYGHDHYVDDVKYSRR